MGHGETLFVAAEDKDCARVGAPPLILASNNRYYRM
jgi:hypothetical protein